MVKIINSWAQGIIIVAIISTIIEMILPEGNNKKYVKVILGFYVLFVIINPIISGLSKSNISFNTILNKTNKEMEKYNNNYISIETNSYIEDTYKNNLKKDIESKLKEKGFNTKNIKLYIETENEEKYGQINSIVLEIEKENIEENVNNRIEEININTSNKKTKEVKEEIQEDDINTIKEYFVNTYCIEKERIHINE